MRTSHLSIAGQNRPAQSNATFERINPLSNEPVTRAAAATAADALAAADAAATAFARWSETGPGERRKKLLRAADLMERSRDAFVEIMTEETGATRMWAEHNVFAAAAILREAGCMTTQIGGEVIPSDKPGCLAMACASRPASCSASRRGTRRSSSACARSPCRWPAATR